MTYHVAEPVTPELASELRVVAAMISMGEHDNARHGLPPLCEQDLDAGTFEHRVESLLCQIRGGLDVTGAWEGIAMLAVHGAARSLAADRLRVESGMETNA